MSTKSYRKIISDVRRTMGDAALKGLPPIAVNIAFTQGSDPASSEALIEPSVILQPTVHPLVEAQMELSGATRRGSFTWSVGLGEESDQSPARDVLDIVDVACIYPASALPRQQLRPDLADRSTVAARRTLELYREAGIAMSREFHRTYYQRRYLASHPVNSAGRYGALVLSTDGRSFYMRFATNGFEYINSMFGVELGLRPVGRAGELREPRAIRGALAATIIEHLEQMGVTFTGDIDAMNTLRLVHDRTLTAWPTPGRPALATVVVGANVPEDVYADLGVVAPDHNPDHTHFGPYNVELPVNRRRMVTTAALEAELANQDGMWDAAVDPSVADVAKMAHATVVDDPTLRPWQQEVVGLHMSTRVGFVNAIAPGMGKTICTLAAMRLRAKTRPNYRGLVLVEANVRDQWSKEATEWFPEAKIVQYTTRAEADMLADALASAGPVVVVTSYSLASDAGTAELPDVTTPVKERFGQQVLFDMSDDDPNTIVFCNDLADEEDGVLTPGQMLISTKWDDLVADEAMGLRSTGSKLSQALWRLRGCAEVAVALTGTPIERGLDDLGRMLAWCRGSRELFHGVRLEKMFNIFEEEDLAALTDALGPLVYRRDKSEISDEVPEVVTEVHRLTPTYPERALARAARDELKRAYDELVTWLEMSEKMDPDNPRFAEVKEALKDARGAWLGGTSLARMAASDPSALLTSESAGAALLASQGLIADALSEGATKRAWIVDYVTREVAAGEKILCFTEYATVAKGLIKDLRDHGVAVGEVLGGGGRRRDRFVSEFQDGNIDVLVCTTAGERGLNLQAATQVLMVEPAWTPGAVMQRVARSCRLNSKNDKIKAVFPVMKDTIEERVVALVSARAATAMTALDGSRGIDVSKTEMGQTMSDLIIEADENQLGNNKESNMLAMTRQLLSA